LIDIEGEFDVDVSIRFSVRIEFVVVLDGNWERWDSVADDGEMLIDWSFEIGEEMFAGNRDDEAL
jgi:hypothetical protein